jgi:signal transduction histidine kinase
MRLPRSLAEFALYASILIIFLFLVAVRPSIYFFAFPLAPIALAALLYGFMGGTFVAMAAMAFIAVLIALDPDAVRRGMTLLEVWPILVVYLATGPAVGWLVARERENERNLVAAERQRMSALSAIGGATREIALSLDLSRTLNMVMAKAVETLPMDAGALFMFNNELQSYQVVVNHNLSSEHVDEITFGFDEGVPGWVVSHKDTLLISNAMDDNRVHPYVVEDGVKSVLAVPLIAREKVVGVLNLYSKTEINAFNEVSAQLAQVFADQAAIFIENAQLWDELQHFAEDLEAQVEIRTRELKETQAQVMRTEKLAVVGRLAASVAHEVNNPLQAITLQLQLIAEEQLGEGVRQRLEGVQEEISRIAGIVHRLLDFQRPTPGSRKIHDVSKLLGDVLALAEKQLQQRDVSLISECHKNLSPVLVNGGQIKQVFLNIILNALESMPSGGELQVRAFQENGSINIHFEDTGVGMSPVVMEHLFEPFYSTKHEGSGLGLAISHEIVTKHGGQIEVSSELINGTTFCVRLPVTEEI